MAEIARIEWHTKLLEDIQDLEFTGIVITKHAIGKRILQDEDKFGKPEYGSKKIEGLAKDLDIDYSDLYRCILFARKYPEIGPSVQNLSWRHIRTKLLPANPDWYQSSESVEWPTPQWLFDLLDKEFHFTLDVCATEKSAKCKKYYTKVDDGLKQDWEGICWMNPPYGKEIADWMAKAKKSSDDGATVVCLVPARPDTNWWWDNAIEGEIRFIHGRLKWPGSDTMAPFPSAVVILSKHYDSGVIWWEISKNN